MSFFNKIKQYFSSYSWDLAYGNYDDGIIVNGITRNDIHIVKNPFNNKWFADPFILDDSVEYLTLLVEEYDYSVKKGRIARIRIDKTINTIVDCKIVLELPTHLSFPAIYMRGDKIFIHPENSASGVSAIYEYDKVSECLINPIIVSRVPLVDAIILEKGSKYNMYATKTTNTCGSILDVYESDSFLGNYSYSKSIDYKKHEARMAGSFIRIGEDLIRPAQDCNNHYGEAVIFYNEDKIIGRLSSPFKRYDGLHTFNKKDRTFIIDLKRFRFQHLRTFIKRFIG